MCYSSGNYEAFARPRKPQGVENKSAWFVGSGLAALAGIDELEKGFAIRGGRERELDKTQIGALLREFKLVGGD